MAKDCKSIYGWDDNKAEEARIADLGLRCMKKNQSTGEAESSKTKSNPGSDSSDITGNLGDVKP